MGCFKLGEGGKDGDAGGIRVDRGELARIAVWFRGERLVHLLYGAVSRDKSGDVSGWARGVISSSAPGATSERDE